MSCEFKPGDKVRCIGRPRQPVRPDNLVVGAEYTIARVVRPMTREGVVTDETRWLLELHEVTWETGCDLRGAYRPCYFVKAIDLTAWLGRTTTFEEPKRVRSPA